MHPVHVSSIQFRPDTQYCCQPTLPQRRAGPLREMQRKKLAFRPVTKPVAPMCLSLSHCGL